METRTIFDHETADVIDFDARSGPILSQFGARVLPVAREDDIVVLSERPFPEELEWLNSVGFGPRPANVKFVDRSKPIVANGLDLKKAEVIYPFSATSALTRELAGAYGCQVYGPERDLAIRLNLKSTFQSWRTDENRIPEGEVASSPAKAAGAIKSLLERHETVRYKPDFSASGIEQKRFTSVPSETKLEASIGMWPGVVQAEVPKLWDASCQFQAFGPEMFKLLELTGQHVDEKGDFQGGYYPISMYHDVPPWLGAEMRQVACSIASAACKNGFIGKGSVDLMVNPSRHYNIATDRRSVWPSEANLRTSAQSYALEMMLLRFGEVSPYDMRSFGIPKGIRFKDLIYGFRGLLYDPNTREGLVLFCFLPQVGFCYGVVYGQNTGRCRRRSKLVEKRKRELGLI